MNGRLKALIAAMLYLLPLSGYAQYFPDTAWTRCYGGSGFDQGLDIRETFDGGYIVLGRSNSNDGDLTGSISGTKTWVLKLDSLGNIEWQKYLGLPHNSKNIRITHDSCYLVGGGTLKKLDQNGNIIWEVQRQTDYVIQTLDSGYAITYNSTITKLDADTMLQWYEIRKEIMSLEQASDGSIITGEYQDPMDVIQGDFLYSSRSQSGTFNFQEYNNIGYWQDKINVKPSLDGKFIIAGTGSAYMTPGWAYIQRGYDTVFWTNNLNCTAPYDFLENPDSTIVYCGRDSSGDAVVGRTTPLGNEIAAVSFGGSSVQDRFERIIKTRDTGYITIGTTSSNDGDVWNNHGGGDMWIVKFKRDTFSYVPVVQSVKGVSRMDEVRVYPTLTDGKVNVAVPSGEKAVFELYDAVGRSVPVTMSGGGKAYQLRFDMQPAGMYILQVSCGGERKSFRVTYAP